MRERITEWEVQRVANNIDRINDYRRSSGGDVMNYVDASTLKGRMSEWDVQRAANNIDRINDYRRGNNSGSNLSLEANLFQLAVWVGVIIFIGLIVIFN